MSAGATPPDDGLRVSVDADVCIASGQCMLAVPTVFDQDDDGRVTVISDRPDARDAEAIIDAAAACPSGAIRLSPMPD